MAGSQIRRGLVAWVCVCTVMPGVAWGQASPTPNPVPPSVAAPEAQPGNPFEERVAQTLGQAGGLTSSAAAHQAMLTSFDVQARRQDILAASAAVEQAVAELFPRLSLQMRYARVSPLDLSLGVIVAAATDTTPGPLPAGTQLVNVPFAFQEPENDVRFSEGLTVPLSDYLLRASQAYSAATHSRRAAELTERATRLNAAINARVAYYTWVRARLQVIVAEQALAQARDHRTDVGHSFDAGAVSQADVLRVDSQVASSALLVARAQNLEIATGDQLRTLMHLDPMAALAIGEDIRAELPRIDGAEDFTQVFGEALAHRPELIALGETVDSLHQQAVVARAGYFPRLEGFGDVLTANPNPRFFPPTAVFNTSWEVGVALSWSPNDVGIAIARAHATDANTAHAVAQQGALRDQLRNEVMQAFTALREASVAIQTTATGLAAAEESYRVRHVLFRNGRATSVELTDAENDVTRARLDALNSRIDLRIARERLMHATGRDDALLR